MTSADSPHPMCPEFDSRILIMLLLLTFLIATEYYLYTHGYGIIAMLSVLLLPP